MCEWDDTAHKADERASDGREGEQQLVVVVVAVEEAKVGLRYHTTLHAQSLK